MLDIKQLNIFVTVVEQGSFSAAAEYLCCTQPTITKAIQHLEQQVKDRLFYVSDHGRKRQVELTYLGQYIHQHALTILEQHQQLLSGINKIQTLNSGQLRLGLPPLGAILLSHIITHYHHRYPHITLNFLEFGALKIEEMLLAKQIDVGIVLGDAHADLYTLEILNSPLCLISQAESKWVGRDSIDFIELKDEKFLFYNDDFSLNPMLLKAAHHAGFQPNIVCRSSQWDFIIKMVEAGMGIAILPKIYCQQFQHLHCTHLKQQDLKWQLHMAWHKRVHMTNSTQAWLNLVEEHKHKIHF